MSGSCRVHHRCSEHKASLAVIVTIIGSLASLLLLHSAQQKTLFVFSFLCLIPYGLGVEWVFRGQARMGFSALWNVAQQAVFLALLYLLVSSDKELAIIPLCKAAGILAAALCLLIILEQYGQVPLSCPHSGGLICIGYFPCLGPVFHWPRWDSCARSTGIWILFFWELWTNRRQWGCTTLPTELWRWLPPSAILLRVRSIPFFRTTLANPSEYRRKLKKMFGCVATLGIAGMGLTYLLRSHIAVWVFGAGYSGAGMALAILSMAILGDFMVTAFGVGFISAGHERLALIIVSIGAASNLCFNLFLIPRYSFVGAALATVSSYVLMGVCDVVCMRKILPKRLESIGQR